MRWPWPLPIRPGNAIALDLQRTSSRGLYWLEPLLEVDSPQGRIGFGPLTAADVPSVLDALQGEPSAHPLALGLVEELPYLKTQQRLLFARAGITRPLSLEDYRAHGGFEGLTQSRRPGRRADRDRGVRFGPAWPWRRGLPGRDQMAHGARHPGCAEIHCVQRRRRRLRHLRRPHVDGRRPLPADRRHGHCRHHRRRQLRLHLRALGISTSRGHPARGAGHRPVRRLPRRQCRRQRPGFRYGSARRGRGLYLR